MKRVPARGEPDRVVDTAGAPGRFGSAWVVAGGGMAVAVGLVALLGWQFDSDTLKSIVAGWVPIRRGAAIGFVVCGAALILTGSRWGHHPAFKKTALAVGSVIAFLGLAILAGYVLGFQMGIHSLLDAIVPGIGPLPDQIAPATALTFGFIGLAVAAANSIASPKVRIPLVAGLGAASAVIGCFAAMGYFLDFVFDHSARRYTGMAFPTAVGFLSLGVGTFALAWKEDRIRWTLSPVVTTGFALSIGLMLLSVGIGYDFTHHLMESAGVIARRQEALKEIEEINYWSIRLESRRTGDVLAHGWSSPSPESGARQIIGHDLGELRLLTSDNPRQQARVAELESLLIRFLENGQPESFSGRQITPSLDAVPSMRPPMERIRTLLAVMREEEYDLLATDQATARAIAEATFLYHPLGTFLSVAILLTGLSFLNAGITQRKEAEQALREREQRFRRERAVLRALLDSIPDLIFIKDRDSVFLGCNLAFQRKFGIRETDLIGKTDFDITSPERAHAFRQMDRELFASGEMQRAEEWITFPAGEGGFFDTLKTPFYDADGKSLGLVGVSRDITERKQADTQIRLTVERMRLAAQAGHVGMWDLDLVTGKGTWDDQMFAIFGQQPVDSNEGAERWFRVMHPEDIPKCRAIMEDAMHSGRDAFDLEFRIFRSNDGELRFIKSKGIVERDRGNVVRMIGINRDVTEEHLRKEKMAAALVHEQALARQAEAGNRAKSEFLAVMSHEIRTPMNGILGFAEILADAPNLPDDCREQVGIILRSSEAMLRILDDILDYSRLEAGEVRVEPVPYPPRQLVKDVVALLEPHATGKSLGFDAIIDPGVPESVIGDDGRLRQVLLNLVGNALKFTEKGGVTISLRCASEPGESGRAMLRFSVRDTGPGIEPARLEHIFKPFAQGDSSTSRKFGGTGLGLSVSQRITELLGGHLTVNSEPGKGSEFILALPLIIPRITEPPARAETELLDGTFAGRHPLEVLIVEDDTINLKLACMLVKKLGYAPHTAKNGVEAVEVFKRERPTCIFMDLQMPEMDGAEATRTIRALERQTPEGNRAFISALTANIFPADRQRCLEAGMNSYLNKPIKLTDLARILAEASKAVSSGTVHS